MAATQETQSTQQRVDPRRFGHNVSGLCDEDVADVVCILHPSSPAAFRIVAFTVARNPQHVLQNQGLNPVDENGDAIAESQADTLLLTAADETDTPRDLALRFSSKVSDPTMGFCFGRNYLKCDINLDPENHNRRVSNVHFRIYLNEHGVLMLEDVSTNGTVVDGNGIGGKKHRGSQPKARMLQHGSMVEILAPSSEDQIKFILRIPSRDDHYDQYAANFRAYVEHISLAQHRANDARQGLQMTEAATRAVLAAPLAGPVNAKAMPKTSLPRVSHNYGMAWDGGGRYNCVGVLGKGAFAIVYQVATIFEGELFAAKELEKRRFVKDGRLDTRIDSEMEIMQQVNHPNIVKFIEYEETKNHLYLIMEFVAGGDLQGYMQSHASLQEPLAKEMTRQILSALEHLHTKDITHRDIKPDNILIASETPFLVKLTDFGLSKVVRNNDTFLRTFCGTLLYCAPEVFPHYDHYLAKDGRLKRRRHNEGQANRSYGQSVDIWSYGAVLFSALCGKPPFEGVVDSNGRGMLERIMTTELDLRPLKEWRISDDACHLITLMLDTDPTTRITETKCLRHPWLNDGQWMSGPEGDHEDHDAASGLDASHLSIHDPEEAPAGESQGSIDSQKMHSAKRLRGDVDPDGTPRQESGFQRPITASGSIGPCPEHLPDDPPDRPRLFGEISPAVLQRAGVLNLVRGLHASHASQVDSAGNSFGNSDILKMEYQLSGPFSGLDGAATTVPPRQLAARTSLSGAESMVRELNMHSPSGPRTPEGEPTSSGASVRDAEPRSEALKESSEDTTPKQRRTGRFERQIHLPITASAYYDPYDETTHNVEFASKVSGHDFSVEPSASEQAVKSLPATVQASFRQPGVPEPHSQTGTQESHRDIEPFAILTTTSDSFTNLTLSITQRITTWGRLPTCDLTYDSTTDTRIPKVGLELIFDAPGIAAVERDGRDWRALRPLRFLVLTKATQGIWVNNVKLSEKEKDGQRRCYGHLAHGDIVDVYRARSAGSELSGGSEEADQRLRFRVDIRLEGARWERKDKPFEALIH